MVSLHNIIIPVTEALFQQRQLCVLPCSTFPFIIYCLSSYRTNAFEIDKPQITLGIAVDSSMVLYWSTRGKHCKQ